MEPQPPSSGSSSTAPSARRRRTRRGAAAAGGPGRAVGRAGGVIGAAYSMRARAAKRRHRVFPSPCGLGPRSGPRGRGGVPQHGASVRPPTAARQRLTRRRPCCPNSAPVPTAAKQGKTQMHADQQDARKSRLNRHRPAPTTDRRHGRCKSPIDGTPSRDKEARRRPTIAASSRALDGKREHSTPRGATLLQSSNQASKQVFSARRKQGGRRAHGEDKFWRFARCVTTLLREAPKSLLLRVLVVRPASSVRNYLLSCCLDCRPAATASRKMNPM